MLKLLGLDAAARRNIPYAHFIIIRRAYLAGLLLGSGFGFCAGIALVAAFTFSVIGSDDDGKKENPALFR
jgi:hypothetical protein